VDQHLHHLPTNAVRGSVTSTHNGTGSSLDALWRQLVPSRWMLIDAPDPHRQQMRRRRRSRAPTEEPSPVEHRHQHQLWRLGPGIGCRQRHDPPLRPGYPRPRPSTGMVRRECRYVFVIAPGYGSLPKMVGRLGSHLAHQCDSSRGRGPGYPGPPAQIPACGFPAPGSC
jgi:hypothetical protein